MRDLDDFLNGPANNSYDAERMTANTELIQILTQYLITHPHERFGQALRNLGIVEEVNSVTGPFEIAARNWVNEFSVEPTVVLKRVKDGIMQSLIP